MAIAPSFSASRREAEQMDATRNTTLLGTAVSAPCKHRLQGYLTDLSVGSGYNAEGMVCETSRLDLYG